MHSVKRLLKNDEQWLKARKIGGSDLACLFDASTWETPIDLYKRLALHESKPKKDNPLMEAGREAEDHIRSLFAIDMSKELEVECPPKEGHWLFHRKDKSFITCTPDGLLKSKADGKSGGLEIKYVSLYKDEQKAIWLTNQIPDKYYWQIIQYLVAMPELSYVYLFAHLRFFTKLGSGWVFDHSEERLYPFKREEVQKDIELAEQIETSFWKENVKKKIEPSPVKED